MPAGVRRKFQRQLEELEVTVRMQLARAFSSDEYQQQLKALREAGEAQCHRLLEALDKEALAKGFILQPSPTGVAAIPLIEGWPMTPQEYLTLSEAERRALDSRQQDLMRSVEEAFDRGRSIERQNLEKLKELDRQVAEAAIRKPLAEVQKEYREYEEAAKFLNTLLEFAVERAESYRGSEKTEADPWRPDGTSTSGSEASRAFRVNVLVDHSDAAGPPVVSEPNPTWANLFGKIERRAVMGTYVSDHTLLRAGAIHRANGGYLILNARDLLLNPGVWEGLKRTIRSRQLRIEDPGEAFGLFASQGLRPEPMPLNLKLIVTGDNLTYQILSRVDEDFWELFKVKAEFDFEVARTPEHLRAYAQFVCSCCENENLKPFNRGAIAKLIEHASRHVADKRKLSARFSHIKDIVLQADHWASVTESAEVKEVHMVQAIEERVYRSALIKEKMQRMIADGTISIDVSGEVVGQVNGLSVYDFGDVSFGRAARITATTFAGRRGITNVERESQLSGRIHDKGVLIVSGYLGSKYAQSRPLALSASVCFEQSYEGVEGDSASSAELYAILSSLTDLPIRQDLAVTGSVNQKGDVQTVGGINEKVEGFYDLCCTIGLIGSQGVIIPRGNIPNLMLREDVVEAVRDGRFHVYGIECVDQGIELLMSVPAGSRSEDGGYPEASVHGRVQAKLNAFIEGAKGLSDPEAAVY